jgi:hypothetical protein
MKKILVFIAFICISVVIIVGKNIIFAQNCCKDNKEAMKNNCAISDGLQFCASLTTISLKSGYKIVLNTSLKNVTDKKVIIPTVGGFYERYDVQIKDPSGKAVLSNKELAEKEAANNININNEITSIPTGSFRGGLVKELAPQEEFKVEYNLNDFYKFESKGKYQFEISRKLSVDNNLIEIKIESLDIELK